jgi:proteic killer suppression protein
MIKTFRCRDTEKLFFRQSSSKFPPNILRTAQRKLAILDGVESLDDLRIPPGNRLKKLKGDHQDYYSIRINDQ